jgi:hypothetical protein
MHRLQREAELVNPVGLLALLQEFHRDTLAAVLRHEAGAQLIGQYDVNNTYQFIVNREETQLSWLAQAIAELGGTVGQAAGPEPRAAGKGADAVRAVAQEDAREANAFVERWRPRVEAIAHARCRGMLRVILGETLEQQRFFEQAFAGRTDLLGRRGEQLGPSQGEVLPTRWIE